MLTGDFSKAVDAFGKPLKHHRPARQGAVPRQPDPRHPPRPGLRSSSANTIPRPTSPAPSTTTSSQGNATSNFNNFGVKVDHAITDRDRLTLTAFWRPEQLDSIPCSRSPIADLRLHHQYPRPALRHPLPAHHHPTMFTAKSTPPSRARRTTRAGPYRADRIGPPKSASSAAPRTPSPWASRRSRPPATSSSAPPTTSPKSGPYNNYQYSGTLTWINGRHNLKFGGDFLRYPVLLPQLRRHARPPDLPRPLHRRADGRLPARLAQHHPPPARRRRSLPPGLQLLRLRAGRFQSQPHPHPQPRPALRS